ncbi:transporter YfdV [Orbus mooreae]|uniref:transporter YfdV n=1 Tax=Orbus mooreae TaxID=3074107 RepID=UPI00370DA396
MFSIFMADLLPIIVIMALGYASGKRNVFTEDQAKAFNKLVLNYALPAALFVSLVRADRSMLFADMTLTIVSFVGLIISFFVAFYSCKYIFKHTRGEAAVCALIAGSPTIGFLGFAVLDPIYGDTVSTGLVVAIISIIVNAITIPIGLFLLSPAKGENEKGNSGLNSLISALKEPVVWSPILATVLVLVGFKLPAVWDPTFDLIAKANSGVAVFAAGLTLAANKFEFDGEIIYNTLLKLVFMPALLLVLGLMFHMSSNNLQMMVLAGALPPAFSGIIIASRFGVYTRTGTASLAVSVLGFIIAAPAWIFITRYVIGLV